jgi:hypothetical protein
VFALQIDSTETLADDIAEIGGSRSGQCLVLRILANCFGIIGKYRCDPS